MTSRNVYALDRTQYQILPVDPPEVRFQFTLGEVKKLNRLMFSDNRSDAEKFGDNAQQCLQVFLEILGEHLLNIFRECFDDVVRVLPRCLELGAVPPADMLTKFVSEIFKTAISMTDNSYLKLFYAIDVCFMNPEFCRQFLELNSMERYLIQFFDSEKIQIFAKFLSHIQTECFIAELKKFDVGDSVVRMFEIVAKYDMPRDVAKNVLELLFKILEVGLRRSPEISDFFEKEDLFAKINKHMIPMDAGTVLVYYRGILGCSSDEEPINHVVLRGIAQIFRSPDCDYKNKKAYIEFLCAEGRIYECSFCENENRFALTDWFCEDICKSSELWAIYSVVLLKCVNVSQKAVKNVIERIVALIVPPADSSVVSKDILTWITAIIEQCAIQRKNLGDDFIIQKLFVEPSVDDVVSSFALDPFKKLFRLVFSSQRWKQHSSPLMERVMELISPQDGKIRERCEFIPELIAANYSPGILRFFLGNLHRQEVEAFFESTYPRYPHDFLDMFEQGDCGSALEVILPEMKSFVSLFKFVSRIISETNNRFFDNWILSLPKDAAIFSLAEEQIGQFVRPEAPGLPLRIPSLLCLCAPYSTSDPYELYLIGRYSLPVLLKLGIPVSRLPTFNSVISQFVQPESIFEIMRQQLRVLLSIGPQQVSVGRSMYEFVPGERCACLNIVTKGLNQLSFDVKITEASPQPYPLLCFNEDDTALVLRENSLFFHDKPLKKLPIGQWVQIQISKGPSQKADVLVDGESAGSIVCGQQLRLKCIGSSTVPPPIRLFVSCFVTSLDADGSKKNVELLPNGLGVVCVPYYSIASVFNESESLTTLFSLFERMSENEDFVPVVFKIRACAGIPMHIFLKHYIYALKQLSTIKASWLTMIISMLEEAKHEDLASRTQCFADVFFDTEIWTTFGPLELSIFLRNVSVELKSNSDSIDFDMLCSRHIFRHIMYLLHYFKTDVSLTSALKEFLQLFIVNVKSSDYFHGVVEIASYNHMWNFSQESTIHEPLMLFALESEVQAHLVDFIMDCERERKMTLISPELLLQFAFILPVDTGVKCFMKLLDELFNGKWADAFIPMICAAGKRYTFKYDQIWHKLINVLKGNEKVSKKSKHAVSALILAMLVTLFLAKNETQRDIRKKVQTQLLEVCTFDVSVLLHQTVIPALVDLVSMGSRKLPTSTPNMNGLHEMMLGKPVYPPEEIKDFEKQLQGCYSDFEAGLEMVLKSRALSPPFSDDVLTFLSEFLNNCLFKDYKKQSSGKIKAFLDLIGQYAQPDVCSVTLSETFRRMMSNKEPSSTFRSLIGIVNTASARSGAVLRNGLLFQVMFELACSNHSMMPLFLESYITFFNDFPDVSLIGLVEYLGNQKKGWDSKDKKKERKDEKKELTQQLLVFVLCRICLSRLEPDRPNIQHAYVKLVHCLLESKYKKDKKLPVCDDLVGYSYADFIKRSPEQIEALFAPIKADIDEFARVRKAKLSEQLTQTPVSDLEYITSFLFNHVAVGAAKCVFATRQFYRDTDALLRKKEKEVTKFVMPLQRHRIREQILTKQVKSYRVSPFTLPGICPSLVIPSELRIRAPNDDPSDARIRYWDFLGIHPDPSCGLPITEDMPPSLFRYSGSYRGGLQHVTKSFEAEKCDHFLNCQFIRSGFSVPCVLADKRVPMWLVMFAEFDAEKKVIRAVYPQGKQQQSPIVIVQTALTGELGHFFMFCGYLVVELRSEDILVSRPHVYCALNRALEIYSLSVGSFILLFQDHPPVIQSYFQNSLQPTIQSMTEKWKQRQISNLEYLNAINFAGNRRYTNLSSYPIAPRLLRDLSQATVGGPENLRDFTVPLEVSSDTDPDHVSLKKRFSMQHFHHTENLSTSMLVSSIMSRLAPFCQFQWQVNDGWDAGDRHFLSIAKLISIHQRSYFEITPEFFCFPEIFLNLNNFHLPDGSPFDCENPAWAKDAYRFVEIHRSILECDDVTRLLPNWLDLYFGFKLFGEPACEQFNVFNEKSYYREGDPPEISAEKYQWMVSCGCVPFQVFTSPHPQAIDPRPPEAMRVRVNSGSLEKTLPSGNRVSVDPKRAVIRIVRDKLSHERVRDDFLFAIDLAVGSRGLIVLVTFSISKVTAYFVIPAKDGGAESLRPLTTMLFTTPKFSVVHEGHMLAITVCQEEVVFWSITNGWVVNIIPERGVMDVAIDEDGNNIFLAFGNTVRQYTVSGNPVREIVFSEPVSSVTIASNGFSIYHKSIYVGFRSGALRKVQVQLVSGEMEVLSEAMVSDFAITRLKAEGSELNAYDISVARFRQ